MVAGGWRVSEIGLAIDDVMELATESTEGTEIRDTVFLPTRLTCWMCHAIILAESREESDVGSAQKRRSEEGTGDAGGRPTGSGSDGTQTEAAGPVAGCRVVRAL